MKPSKSVRVLFLGDTAGSSTSIHYVTSLVKLGHSVYPFNSDPWGRMSFSERWNFRINKRVPQTVTDRISREIVDLCRQNQFDLVFAMAQNFLSASTLELIRKVSKFPPKLVFHSHDNVFSPGVITPSDFTQSLKIYY